MLSRQPGAAAERFQGGPRNRGGTGAHADAQLAEAVRQFVRITRWHHEDALADPHHTRAVDESLFLVANPRRPFRDPPSSEDDLANPGCDGPRCARDVVR